ncbi:STAS domain-containing protein [Fimbriimonadia bacterium ATM]|nr:MAG: anti-sigma factor antagonist [Armatimonadota bacterium]MBC6969058.1 anti-sigma factor antagonist [Armatimonadota bacterium]MCE7900499.1 anti-sigma factor antagonist [Armatimonadetes bacterium ATM1]MDL1928387.1 STAS domain-containing protein [Fimbriimonadia bacterium ATM]RIJ94978.1 MAG: hypothetical protein DCC45_11555 [Armatimonadota bacterium]
MAALRPTDSTRGLGLAVSLTGRTVDGLHRRGGRRGPRQVPHRHRAPGRAQEVVAGNPTQQLRSTDQARPCVPTQRRDYECEILPRVIVESVADIIKLSGDLPSNQWEAIRTAAGLLLKSHPRGVVVDCSGLTSVTPEGAQTFADMLDYIQSKKARIIVANVPPNVRQILRTIPDVRSGLAMADSVQDAQHSLDLLDELSDGHKRRHSHTTGNLVLALCGGPADSAAIAHAALIAERRQLCVVAAFAIVVPRSLPLSAPLPDEEDDATSALQRAKEALEGKGLEVRPFVERTRSVSALLEALAQDKSNLAAVVSLPKENPATQEPVKTVQQVLSRIPIEVILVREARRSKQA